MGLTAAFTKAFPSGAAIEAGFELTLGAFGLTVAGPKSVSNTSPASPSSANPWFCAVIATRPVAWSITGTLIPRCPNTIL